MKNEVAVIAGFTVELIRNTTESETGAVGAHGIEPVFGALVAIDSHAPFGQ